MADVLTIRGAVARAKADGLPVSEYTLRGWIKSGVVPVRHAGSKMLLYYPWCAICSAKMAAILLCPAGWRIDERSIAHDSPRKNHFPHHRHTVG